MVNKSVYKFIILLVSTGKLYYNSFLTNAQNEIKSIDG